jgi:glycerophosphoryl diester phosphodiesterase
MSRVTAFAGALLTALLVACSSPENVRSTEAAEPPSSRSYPYISAHRAGAAYAPENTLMAIRNARRLGIEDIELDIQLTADNVLVFLHDDTLDRTTDCSGPVNLQLWDSIKDCDAAYWFTPGEPVTVGAENGDHPLRGQGVLMPTADDVFSYIQNNPEDTTTTYTIEVKNVPSEANFDPTGLIVSTALVNKIAEYPGLEDRIIVQSFWPASLTVVQQLNPNLRTLFLVSESITQINAQNTITFTSLNGFDIAAPEHDTSDLDQAAVTAAHDAGLLLVPWTADQIEDLDRMAEVGVDGVITNFPACALIRYERDNGLPVLAPEIAGDDGFDACPSE